MENTRVKKDWLIKKLQDNEEQHAKDYADACKEYCEVGLQLLKKDQETLNQIRADLEKGITTPIQHSYHNHPAPKCHVDDYNTALEMLYASTEDEIVLTRKEFRQLVQDKWDWKEVEFEKTIMYANNKIGI